MKVINRLPQATDFWKKMQENHWIWLHDVRSAEAPPETLPDALVGPDDDPCRALAGYAEDGNVFNKDRQSHFIEFHRTYYFGERIHWRPISRATLPNNLKQALRLAYKPAAKELPGYRQGCPC